ncbi:hypothetical protein J8F10_16605 [Gemmata sp. G18]|uniref:Transposase n=1 Tax=Gemmata palustris TaxID=2822762 RepID=A0ABS5BT51_9BACT|nr:hypothetical protein [Gemmata palustris]MBP3956894.1 hypothetical protein [Gemmata palustris]
MTQCFWVSFRELPPDFHAVLHPKPETIDRFKDNVTKFTRTVVRVAKLEWARVFEWVRGVIHAHLLLRGRLTRDQLKRLRNVRGLRVTCARVRNVQGMAAYFWKHTSRPQKKAELAPTSNRGRLYSVSRRFLTQKFAELRKQVRAERAARLEGQVRHV